MLSPAWTTDWMTDAGKRKLDRVRHRSALRARAASRPGPSASRSACVPALRVARHPRGLALRLDLLQGALRVPRVPRALRPLQGALMSLSPQPARRAARAPRAVRTHARAVPHAHGRGRASAHRRRSRGDLRGARRARRRVRLPRRASTWRCARTLDGSEVRRCTRCAAPPSRRGRHRQRRASSATWAGCSPTWAQTELQPGDRARRDEPRRARSPRTLADLDRRHVVGHRRRLGHHAADGARARPCSPRRRHVAVHARLHEPRRRRT